MAGCSGVELAPVRGRNLFGVGADVTYVAIGSDDHDAAIRLRPVASLSAGAINVRAGLRLDASATAAEYGLDRRQPFMK